MGFQAGDIEEEGLRSSVFDVEVRETDYRGFRTLRMADRHLSDGLEERGWTNLPCS